MLESPQRSPITTTLIQPRYPPHVLTMSPPPFLVPLPSTLIQPTCSQPHPLHYQPPPMRVRVHILTSSYRIPCPHLQEGGVVTSVAWLANQAAERYFSQHGRRPVLSLTTADGDSLFQADPVGHVLSQDEEVVGVVQQWFTPPMLERYLVACRTNGAGKENVWIDFKPSKTI